MGFTTFQYPVSTLKGCSSFQLYALERRNAKLKASSIQPCGFALALIGVIGAVAV
jgi:hypothetical protein